LYDSEFLDLDLEKTILDLYSLKDPQFMALTSLVFDSFQDQLFVDLNFKNKCFFLRDDVCYIDPVCIVE
jgi:hypothetical protein